MAYAAKMIRPRTAVLFLMVAALIGEIVARVWLGLGTPPLFVPHPTIEYMYKPGQDVMRFGNRQLYNELGMRNLPLASFGNREVVMVFGDSVLNGGAQTDHQNLATSLLTNDRVVYANISAGSWGPQNMAAYWTEFRKLLPYKKAILVLNSHDIADIPSFAPLDPAKHPTQAPTFALLEGAQRYLPRYLPAGWFGRPSAAQELPSIARTQLGEQGVHRLIEQFRRDGVSLCAVRHYTVPEMRNGPEPGDSALRSVLEKHALPVVDLRRHYPPGAGKETFFRDDIHFNDAGQAILAKAVAECASIME